MDETLTINPSEETVETQEIQKSTRPLYLSITQIAKPAKHVVTSKGGWTEHNENWDITEYPEFLPNVSNRVLTAASFIIDLKEHKVIKNRFATNIPDAKVIDSYMTKYARIINETISHLNKA